ncbi:MAG: two-component system response regulator [Pedosphaera sp.]|nr:two-component system response regulator [Pedosphaera sp.]
MSYNTILLIEDEEHDALSLQFAFRQWKVTNRLQIVTSGEQAVAYLSGAGDHSDRTQYPLPTLILLDLGLPQLTGFQVLSWIRSRPEFSHLPVVVLSGSENHRDIHKAYELGANSYLLKLSDMEKLLGQIIQLNQFVLARINSDSVIQFAEPVQPQKTEPLPAATEAPVNWISTTMNHWRKACSSFIKRKQAFEIKDLHNSVDATFCRQLCEQHGYTCTREQASLICRPPLKALDPINHQSSTTVTTQTKPTILFIDDDTQLLRVLSDYLTEMGFKVLTTPDASQAMLVLDHNPTDLIILDLNLGGEDGLQFMSFLKTNYADIPILIYTGLDHDEQQVRDILRNGAYGYASKSQSMTQVVAAIRKILSHGRQDAAA